MGCDKKSEGYRQRQKEEREASDATEPSAARRQAQGKDNQLASDSRDVAPALGDSHLLEPMGLEQAEQAFPGKAMVVVRHMMTTGGPRHGHKEDGTLTQTARNICDDSVRVLDMLEHLNADRTIERRVRKRDATTVVVRDPLARCLHTEFVGVADVDAAICRAGWKPFAPWRFSGANIKHGSSEVGHGRTKVPHYRRKLQVDQAANPE